MFKRRKQVLLFFVLGIISLLIFIGVIVIAGFQDGMILIILPIIFLSISLILCNTMTKYYPLNDYKDYTLDLKNDFFRVNESKTIILKAKEIKKGVWLITVGDEVLIFDLRYYVFPKNYIASFFARQFNFQVVNKKKLGILAVGSNLVISDKISFDNLIIEYNFGNKHKQKYVIKKRKTKVLGINQFIIYGHYRGIWFSTSSPHSRKEVLKYQEVRESKIQRKNWNSNNKKRVSYKEFLRIKDSVGLEDFEKLIRDIE